MAATEHTAPCEMLVRLGGQVSGHHADIDNLLRWQKAQNGTLERLANSTHEGYLRLDEKIDDLNRQMQRAMWAVVLLIGGFVVQLVLMLMGRM